MNQVNLTDSHIQIINQSLETLIRLQLGQFKIALETAFQDNFFDWEDMESVERELRRLCEIDGHRGIHHPEIPEALRAYEILSVLRQFLAVRGNNGFYGSGFRFEDPIQWGDEPLPTVEGFPTPMELEIPASIGEIQFQDVEKWNAIDRWLFENHPHIDRRGDMTIVEREGEWFLVIKRPQIIKKPHF